ncbi:conserved hypothetical protein [Candidatus Desulfosporosinus infrequens]|uniref:Uncharacterized protein n=1 Tax=Candidatus Desulfosporosinus infrequens TaxID=2043169 RepID=A0A2U3KXD2_9FIRM|nr:conserved hypothetical protein [Candidatus Desulfosporosinus infrequens]
MNDLADYKRTNNKKYVKDFLEGIFDVIETDYPDKYFMMLEDHTGITTLISNEEWIDILTKSRNSYSCHIKQINLSKKHPGKLVQLK